MKRSVILTDRVGPDILLVLTMKRQVLHRERAHLKVLGCSLVLSALLTRQSLCQSVTHSLAQSVSQSVNQSVTQSLSQSVSQLFS